MNRSVRIAKALGRAHDRLRRIFNQQQCLKVLTGDQNAGYSTAATYDTHWYLDKQEYSDVIAGKRYKKVWVDDVEGCRLSILKSATAFQIGDDIFTFHGKDSFTSSVPSYEFKVIHLGPRI
jgi:hypothetical protein